MLVSLILCPSSCKKKPTQPPPVQPGEQWTARASGGLYDLRDIATDGNILVAVGDSGRVLTSDSGVNWTLRSTPTTAALSAVAWTANLGFVVVSNAGNGDTVLLSSNGVNWAAPPSTGMTDPINDVTGFGSLLMAVGCNGSVYTSSSGVSWNVRSSNVPICLEGVKWDGLQYIIVGQNGSISTTPSGLTFTPRTSGVTSWFRDIAGECSKIIAVGDGGIIKSSTDNGINWATSDSVGTDLNAVTCSGDSFVAVGDGGAIYTSFDAGLTWKKRTSPTTVSLLGVTKFGSRYVAVGLDGAILTSP